MERVLLSELTWPEVKQSLETGQIDTVVITVGATEQHGHHLPLGTDAILAQWVGEQLARRLGKALLAPPIAVGRSEHHMAFSGTITIRQETLAAILADYVSSLARHGFAKIVLVPTHGGNFRPLSAIAEELRRANPQLKIIDYTDLDDFIAILYGASGEFGVSPEQSGGHSGESETSMILAVRPDLVRMERAKLGYVGPQEGLAPALFAKGVGAINPDGILGDPRPATAEKGRFYLQRLLDRLVEVIVPQLA